MSGIAAIALSAAATTATPAPCAGCMLDVPAGGAAMSILVILGDEHEVAPHVSDTWRAPALGRGWAVLTLAGWEDREPSWLAAQVLVTAKLLPIDLARVYLLGSSEGSAYIARHVQALSETFAAVVITSGGGRPAVGTCPEQTLPVYFLVEAGDTRARALRSYLERCRQPVVWTNAHDLPRGPPRDANRARNRIVETEAEFPRGVDRKTALSILDWLHRHVRVTTVATALR